MKKVSVGTVKDVGVPPQKSRKKGVIILVVVAVVLIVLFMIGNTGCSNKKDTGTTTPKATIVPIPQRVSGLEDRVTYIEQHPVSPFDPTSLQTQITALHNYNDAPLVARVTALEGLNLSTFAADLAFVKVRLAAYDSYNISTRLTAIEARLNASPTATPLPNGSTPTPTPAPSTNHAPTILSLTTTTLAPGSNQSWIVTCAANDSDGDALNYLWANTGGTLLYFSGNSSLLWSLPAVGNYSIVCQVNDGKDGYDLEIKTVTW